MINKILPIIIIILFLSSFSNITYSYSINKNIKLNYNLGEYYRFINYQNGSLSGYVNDSLSNPIDGALVNIKCGGLHMYNNSNSNGFYFIDNIPIVDCYWNVSVSKEDYDTSYVDMAIDINSSYDFILKSSNNILYVGGDGPNNYSRIQDAIDNASSGDVVFVYDGFYLENVFIDIPLTLQGIDKNTTIIDGNGVKDCIYLTSNADGTIITGFTIQHSGNNSGGGFFDEGIDIHASNTVITNNIISDHQNNGIWLWCSNNNNISYNLIKNNHRAGIEANDLRYSTIYRNQFTKNYEWAVMLHIDGLSIDNYIFENTFIDNDYKGMCLARQAGNFIFRNNFIKNSGGHARSDFTFFSRSSSYTNAWDENYWDDWIDRGPRWISGMFSFDIDWNPVDVPYQFFGGV